jgi:hypothetical protein
MFRTGILALVALTLQTPPLQLEAQNACAAKVENFIDEKPILMLSQRDRDGIIDAVLPDLKAQANGSGYDQKDLRPAKLAHSLHYWPISTDSKDEHLWVVRFNTTQACGPHNGCPAYVIRSNPKSVRNVLQGREASFGMSAGGAEGIAVLPTTNATHPELLFLSHISGFETAVGCFVWNGKEYRSVPCAPECAHFLDTPRPN